MRPRRSPTTRRRRAWSTRVDRRRAGRVLARPLGHGAGVDWGHGFAVDLVHRTAPRARHAGRRAPEGMRRDDPVHQPANGYGVQFLDGAAARPRRTAPVTVGSTSSVGDDGYPAGAWLGYRGRGRRQPGAGGRPPTRAVDRAGARVLRARSPVRRRQRLRAGTPRTDACCRRGDLRLCRYGLDDWLEQSELLTGQDASTPRRRRSRRPQPKGDRMCTMALSGPRIVRPLADAEGWVSRWTPVRASRGSTVEHDLTADVLYWVLSPGWSGGVEGDVPMPASSAVSRVSRPSPGPRRPGRGRRG